MTTGQTHTVTVGQHAVSSNSNKIASRRETNLVLKKKQVLKRTQTVILSFIE